MMIPTIHLNGTARERLIEDICEAKYALTLAVDKLMATSPNGRDFYPQGPTALTEATKEHLNRLRRVQEVIEELDQMAIAISDAEGKV